MCADDGTDVDREIHRNAVFLLQHSRQLCGLLFAVAVRNEHRAFAIHRQFAVLIRERFQRRFTTAHFKSVDKMSFIIHVQHRFDTEYTAVLESFGIQEAIDIYQKGYDTYMAR